jgi:hypothetical protein
MTQAVSNLNMAPFAVVISLLRIRSHIAIPGGVFIEILVGCPDMPVNESAI